MQTVNFYAIITSVMINMYFFNLNALMHNGEFFLWERTDRVISVGYEIRVSVSKAQGVGGFWVESV